MSVERTTSSSSFAWCSAITMLISALALFLVQPIISKLILPWYGGSPAVWTTCMLFFQTLLLAGYAYAHLLVRNVSVGWQMRIHGFITLLAALTLPISPSEAWQPLPEANPVWGILNLLTFNVGLPYFALSATAPLVQSWYGGVYAGQSPYRLYALSNFGSLTSLWLFPFGMEPMLDSTQQDLIWSSLFGGYLLLIFVLAVVFERLPSDDAQKIIYPEKAAEKGPLNWFDVAAWVLLPALASSLLVAVTSHICQDVAVVPFLWILPLSLYLVTFIIAFESPRWYIRILWGLATITALLGVCVVMVDSEVEANLNKHVPWFGKSVVWLASGWDARVGDTWKTGMTTFDLTSFTGKAEVETVVFLAAMFGVAMICHGETVRRKPATGRLTLFYLTMSAGGALGSAVVAILCPLIFVQYYELAIGLVCGFLLACAVILASLCTLFAKPLTRNIFLGVSGVALAGLFALVLRAQGTKFKPDPEIIVRMRNFYGVASVRSVEAKSGGELGRILYNGQINHGLQFSKGTRRYNTNSYYADGSGVELAFRALQRQPNIKIGVIGLGTGTLAAKGRKGDTVRFYEIDEKIIHIANNYFTYLKDSPAKVDVVLGDARLSLDHELKRDEKQKFDILVIDAFSGDAIPVHLLTKEAFELYAQHMNEGGVIAVHTSNRHLDLQPIVARLAEEIHKQSVFIELNIYDQEWHEADSDWILVTNNPHVLEDPVIVSNGRSLANKLKDAPLWTDKYSNLLKVLD